MCTSGQATPPVAELQKEARDENLLFIMATFVFQAVSKKPNLVREPVPEPVCEPVLEPVTTSYDMMKSRLQIGDANC